MEGKVNLSPSQLSMLLEEVDSGWVQDRTLAVYLWRQAALFVKF
jgi:hypothetical protein